MDVVWMKLKEYLKNAIDEKDKKWCAHNEIVERRVLKNILDKMEEFENG